MVLKSEILSKIRLYREKYGNVPEIHLGKITRLELYAELGIDFTKIKRDESELVYHCPIVREEFDYGFFLQ